MRLLLDTCALSELFARKPCKAVLTLIEETPGNDLFVSVISIGEIEKGIHLLPHGARRAGIQKWASDMERRFPQSLLKIDKETARIWGEMTAQCQKLGRPLAAADGLIAATAQRHSLQLVTRDIGGFEHTGVALVNPWLT